jgi:pimeloyl-ACP methyl ester carboxylesterase
MMSETYSDHHFRSADDRLDLYARIYGDCSSLIPIVMMHGLTRNSADFETIAEILSPAYQLIIPDQRGRGRSQYDPDPSNYIPDIYVEDMFALLRSRNIDKAVLMGTSMGGLIAMLMAGRHPDKVAALILNDIGPAVDPRGLARLQQYVGKPVNTSNWSEAADHCRETNAIAFPDYGEEDWMNFAHRTFHLGEDGTPELSYDMAISQGVEGDTPSAAPADLWPVWRLLAQIAALVIRGQTSDILAPATLSKMAELHDAAFQAVEIANIGHAPMLDENESIAAIQTFLKSQNI